MDDRHYSTGYEWWETVGTEDVRPSAWDERDDPAPICPECGGLLRRNLDTQQGWRCDIHKAVVPEWVHVNDEREDDE